MKYLLSTIVAAAVLAFSSPLFSNDGDAQASGQQADRSEQLQASPAPASSEVKEPAAPAHVKIENVLRFQHGYVYEFNGDRYVRVGKAEDLDCRILECNPPIYCFKQNGNPCDDYIVGLTVQFNGKNISGSADSDKRTFYLVKAKKARQGKGKKS